MKKISDLQLEGRRVLVRCDFNVPLNEKGEIEDDFRIKKTVPTIEYIVKKGGRAVLMSHLGRPQGRKQDGLSMGPVQDRLVEHLDQSVVKADNCIGSKIEQWSKEMQPGEILLLENLRFHKEEVENDKRFARRLSRLGEVYINEAFSVSHREHASLVSLPQLMPSGMGLLFAREVEALSKLRQSAQRPLVGIIGGGKVEKKVQPITELLNMVDVLLVGGKAGEVLKSFRQGRKEADEGLEKIVQGIDLSSPKLFLPVDGVYEQEKISDIGVRTIQLFKEKIKGARTIFWAGPLGNTDKEEYEAGSREIAEFIKEMEVFSVAGGGDTVSFLRRNGFDKSFNHISTGGSSMLQFLSRGTLPALEVL